MQDDECGTLLYQGKCSTLAANNAPRPPCPPPPQRQQYWPNAAHRPRHEKSNVKPHSSNTLAGNPRNHAFSRRCASSSDAAADKLDRRHATRC
ncbi:hypothetical protein Ae201684P_002658 [Aphanomyces euteiches]|uniref:Uncharacterized protein n=1 Tax=Aphanomyces euteiches TaxID=100861 RepID=A0A6G0X5I4_9STRA|nr:hypothetical protein Ae201684_008358 [Aphanomyces euteiches]KAH9070296.1 hypothetical protein Ae201684P_002658 [Aphanomyces euteiches]